MIETELKGQIKNTREVLVFVSWEDNSKDDIAVSKINVVTNEQIETVENIAKTNPNAKVSSSYMSAVEDAFVNVRSLSIINLIVPKEYKENLISEIVYKSKELIKTHKVTGNIVVQLANILEIDDSNYKEEMKWTNIEEN